MKKLFAILALTGTLMRGHGLQHVRGAAADVESTTDCADGVDNNC